MQAIPCEENVKRNKPLLNVNNHQKILTAD